MDCQCHYCYVWFEEHEVLFLEADQAYACRPCYHEHGEGQAFFGDLDEENDNDA